MLTLSITGKKSTERASRYFRVGTLRREREGGSISNDRKSYLGITQESPAIMRIVCAKVTITILTEVVEGPPIILIAAY